MRWILIGRWPPDVPVEEVKRRDREGTRKARGERIGGYQLIAAARLPGSDNPKGSVRYLDIRFYWMAGFSTTFARPLCSPLTLSSMELLKLAKWYS